MLLRSANGAISSIARGSAPGNRQRIERALKARLTGVLTVEGHPGDGRLPAMPLPSANGAISSIARGSAPVSYLRSMRTS